MVPTREVDKGRVIFLLFVSVFVLAVGYSTIFRAAWSPNHRTDFTVYRMAGQAVIDGSSIYDAQNSRGWNYIYPPPFATLMVPFAKISIAWGSAIWYGLSMLALASALWMSVQLARELYPPVRSTGVGWALMDGWSAYELPAFLISPWLLSGLFRCQVSAWMIWMMIAAVYFAQRGRNISGGVCLAAAALMKVFPLALLGWFVWNRQWRFILGFLVMTVVGGFVLPATVYGWQQNLDYWQQWVQIMGKPALASNDARRDSPLYNQLLDSRRPRSQSIESVLLTFDVSPEQTKPILVGIALAMLASMLWVARQLQGNKLTIIAAAFTTWNVLIPPISHSHYFGLLIFPLAILTGAATSAPNENSRRLAVGMLVVFFVIGLWSTLDNSVQTYRPLAWLAIGIWCTLLSLACRLESSLKIVRPVDSVGPVDAVGPV